MHNTSGNKLHNTSGNTRLEQVPHMIISIGLLFGVLLFGVYGASGISVSLKVYLLIEKCFKIKAINLTTPSCCGV